MPLYEYECPTCGTFELIRKFSDAPVVACPTCGREVVKLQSAPAFQFKGTGWYVTDYARKGKGTDTGSESKGGSSGDKAKASESSGSESKSGGSESKGSGSDSAASSSESKSSSSETKTGASESKASATSTTTKSGSS